MLYIINKELHLCLFQHFGKSIRVRQVIQQKMDKRIQQMLQKEELQMSSKHINREV